MRSKRMTTITVNPAWPAAKEIIDGAIPETRTAIGRSAQSAGECDPIPTKSVEPITKPTVVPPIARSAVDPVPRAFERSTARVPSTTQMHVRRSPPRRPRPASEARCPPDRVAEPDRLEREVAREPWPIGGHATRRCPRGARAPAGRLRPSGLERGVGHHRRRDTEGARVNAGSSRILDARIGAASGEGAGRSRSGPSPEATIRETSASRSWWTSAVAAGRSTPAPARRGEPSRLAPDPSFTHQAGAQLQRVRDAGEDPADRGVGAPRRCARRARRCRRPTRSGRPAWPARRAPADAPVGG